MTSGKPKKKQQQAKTKVSFISQKLRMTMGNTTPLTSAAASFFFFFFKKKGKKEKNQANCVAPRLEKSRFRLHHTEETRSVPKGKKLLKKLGKDRL